MATYQNSSVTSTKLILGNAKIEIAATTVGSAYTNLGVGVVNSFKYTPTMYDVQAGNGPDPIQGIASEECTVDFELIEFDGEVLESLTGGAMVSTGTTTQTVVCGGNSTVTPKIFRITNSSTVGGVIRTTVLTIFKGYLTSGFALNFKGDNDSDPIAVMPCTITGKVDATLTAGSQLFKIVKKQ